MLTSSTAMIPFAIHQWMTSWFIPAAQISFLCVMQSILGFSSILRTVYLISPLGYLINISYLPHPRLTPDLSSVPLPKPLLPTVFLLVNENNGNHILSNYSGQKPWNKYWFSYVVAAPCDPLISSILRIWQLSTLFQDPSSFCCIII